MPETYTFEQSATPTTVLVVDSGWYTAKCSFTDAPTVVRSVTAEERDAGVISFVPPCAEAETIDELVDLVAYAAHVALETAVPEAEPSDYAAAQYAVGRGVRGAARMHDEELA